MVVSPAYNLSRGRRLSGKAGGGKNCEELSHRSSTGSSRSDLIPGRMSLGTAPRTSTGSGDHLARFETGDY